MWCSFYHWGVLSLVVFEVWLKLDLTSVLGSLETCIDGLVRHLFPNLLVYFFVYFVLHFDLKVELKRILVLWAMSMFQFVSHATHCAMHSMVCLFHSEHCVEELKKETFLWHPSFEVIIVYYGSMVTCFIFLGAHNQNQSVGAFQ